MRVKPFSASAAREYWAHLDLARPRMMSDEAWCAAAAETRLVTAELLRAAQEVLGREAVVTVHPRVSTCMEDAVVLPLERNGRPVLEAAFSERELRRLGMTGGLDPSDWLGLVAGSILARARLFERVGISASDVRRVPGGSASGGRIELAFGAQSLLVLIHLHPMPPLTAPLTVSSFARAACRMTLVALVDLTMVYRQLSRGSARCAVGSDGVALVLTVDGESTVHLHPDESSDDLLRFRVHEISHSNQRGQQMQEISPFGRVRVTVDIVVGSVELTVGQLLELSPGSVLELEGAVDQVLHLAVSGEPIATARFLVEDGKPQLMIESLEMVEGSNFPGNGAIT